MGAKVCKKCGIRQDSPYIIDNTYRKHCRVHDFLTKEKGTVFVCTDCGCSTNAKHNCRHVFVYKLCCFIKN